MDPHIYLQEPRQTCPVSRPQPCFLSCVHAVRKLSESLGYMVEHDSEWLSMGNPCKRCMYISTFTVCSLPVDACCKCSSLLTSWLCISLHSGPPLLSPLLAIPSYLRRVKGRRTCCTHRTAFVSYLWWAICPSPLGGRGLGTRRGCTAEPDHTRAVYVQDKGQTRMSIYVLI